MESFFKLKENGTNVRTEILAGLTTFFAMAYIVMVNPDILSATGMPWGAVFLATIAASIIGTLVMGLFANVPYAQAPGMGLNAFFTFTVVFSLGFTWQEALAMVFICGIINILITVTNIRKLIIKCIPESLQNAIGGGIGIFIAYIGLQNAGLIGFGAGVPELVPLNNASVLLTLFGLAVTVILLVRNVKGAIFIGIIITTLLGIPFGVTQVGDTVSLSEAFSQLGTTFGAAFGNPGMLSLFSDLSKLPLVLMTIFAFSLSDTFDTIGTFIGTGRRAGIFSAEDMKALETSSGFKSKMDRAPFCRRHCHIHRRHLRYFQHHHLRGKCCGHRSRRQDRLNQRGCCRTLLPQRLLCSGHQRHSVSCDGTGPDHRRYHDAGFLQGS